MSPVSDRFPKNVCGPQRHARHPCAAVLNDSLHLSQGRLLDHARTTVWISVAYMELRRSEQILSKWNILTSNFNIEPVPMVALSEKFLLHAKIIPCFPDFEITAHLHGTALKRSHAANQDAECGSWRGVAGGRWLEWLGPRARRQQPQTTANRKNKKR